MDEIRKKSEKMKKFQTLCILFENYPASTFAYFFNNEILNHFCQIVNESANHASTVRLNPAALHSEDVNGFEMEKGSDDEEVFEHPPILEAIRDVPYTFADLKV